MKLIDLNYHASNEYSDPEKVIKDHWPSLGYITTAKKSLDIEIIKHINYKGKVVTNNIEFSFFKSNNRFWYIPFRTHRYIKSQQPRVIIVQGFVFPLQLIFLRFQLGNPCAICLQHHGEQPFKGIKGMIQRFADRFVNAYSFAAIEMAAPWIDAGVISSINKCYEIMGVSTSFKKEEKEVAKRKTGISGSPAFLWVGRLNDNKDPFTVLKAFEKYLLVNPHAMLYMIYQQNDLEKEVRSFVNESSLLISNVKLKGKIQHEELSDWFNAADFYVSGSHREGSGYALIEAMACGCVPIVTSIPSFKKITDEGNCGLLYEAGNTGALLDAFVRSQDLDLSWEISKALKQFESNLSFEAYAKQVQSIIDIVTE
ncbi:MAG: glycosyltransferase family 4 protein [Ferruginibacter sp.]|nr:glycosyltransferase family 4 protein [Ferruginibacter sp.]